MRGAACTRARACACMVVSLREWSGQGGACCPSQRCGAAPLGWAVHAGAAEGPAHRPTCVVGAVGEAVVRRLRDHVRKVQPLNGAVQWCSAAQRSAAQRSAVQRSAVQCSAVQRSAAQRSAAQWSAALCRAVPRPTHSVQCRACRHHCGSQPNPSHAMFTRGPAIGTAPFESFRKFPKVLPRCEWPRERGVSAAAARPFRTCTCAARPPAVSE